MAPPMRRPDTVRIARKVAMPNESPQPELIADDPAWPRSERTSLAGAGWFDSSWELRRGLEVREGWSDADGVGGWIEDFLLAQRAMGRTASPSASTAIA
jgi:hypothetical protein